MFTAEQTIQMERERRAFEKGEEKGRAGGFAEAEASYERYDKLVGLLIDAGRWDDLRRRKDEGYREQLYAELGI